MPPEMNLSKEQRNAMENAAAMTPLPNKIVPAKKATKAVVPVKKAPIVGQTRRAVANVAIQKRRDQLTAKVIKHRGIPDKVELLKQVNEVKEEFRKENAINKTPSNNDKLKQQAEQAAIDAVTKAIERTADLPLENLAKVFETNASEITTPVTNEGDPTHVNTVNSTSASDPGETVSAAVAGAQEAAKELAGNPVASNAAVIAKNAVAPNAVPIPKNAVAPNATVAPNASKNAIAHNNINKAIANNATEEINGSPSNVSPNNLELSDARRLVATINLNDLLPEPDSDISSAVQEAANESNVQKAADIAYKAVMKAGGTIDQAIRAAYMAAFKVLVKSGKSLFDITKTATKVVLDIALQAGVKLGDVILSIAKAAALVFFKIIRSAGLTLGVAVRLTFNLIITLLKLIGAPIAELTTLAGQVVYDVGIKAGESATEFIKTVATTIAREVYSAAINSGATAKMAGELAFEAVVHVLKQIGYAAALITIVAVSAVKDAVVELTRIATNAAIALARAAAEQAYKQAISAGKGAEAAASAAFEASVAAIKRVPGITLDIGAIAGNAAVYAITNLGKYTAQIAGLIAKMAATLAYQLMVASGAVLADAAKAAANTAIPIAAKVAENVKDVIKMAAQAGVSAATSVATKAASSIWSGLKLFGTRKNRPSGSNGELNMSYPPPSRSIEPPNGSPSSNAATKYRQRTGENIKMVEKAQGFFHPGHEPGKYFRGLTEGTHANPVDPHNSSRIRKQTQLYGNPVRYGGRRTRRR